MVAEVCLQHRTKVNGIGGVRKTACYARRQGRGLLGQDVQRDIPCDFFDLSWIAVRNGDVDGMVRALALSDPLPVRWMQGLHAVAGDFWDFEAHIESSVSRVFVTPRLDGWLLGIGGWLSGTGEGGEEDIAERCRVLSSIYGRACVFTTQGRMDYYSWTLAADGRLERRYVWNGEVVADEGTASKREIELVEAHKAEFLAGHAGEGFEEKDWHPNEFLVMPIAAAFSLDIEALGPATRVEGQGFLCTTRVGRDKGVPKRPLCNCASISDACG